MSVSEVWGRVGHWFGALPPHKQVLLALATAVFLGELALRRFARGTRFYARWTAAFEAIGSFWSAVLLSLVYFVTVALISVLQRAFGKDPLDRAIPPTPPPGSGGTSFWHVHEPNPLGPLAAARHQF